MFIATSILRSFVVKSRGSKIYLKCIKPRYCTQVNTVLYSSTKPSIVSDKEKIASSHVRTLPLIYFPKSNELIDLTGLTDTQVHSKIAQWVKDPETASKLLENDYLKANLQGSGLLPAVDITSEIEDKFSQQKRQSEQKLLGVISTKELEWSPQTYSYKDLPKHYMKLSKIRLTGLVVLTTLAGYGLAPGIIELTTLLLAVVGTGLTSCAANTINQFLEIPYDSQMNRTKNRILVKGILSPLHAVTFASICAILGVTILSLGVSNIVAALGLTNLLLYTCVYTPMKRISILNTWIGSMVGAIPPVMGWVACTGQIDLGALLLAGLLFSWQFPHFNALSWNLRPDYSRAGYRMMSVTDPDLCRRTALRHSIAIFAMCSVAPIVGVTDWTFAVDSAPLNAYLVYCSWKFYRDGDSASSRKLFRLSLVHLPVMLMLMFISKKYKAKNSDVAVGTV